MNDIELLAKYLNKKSKRKRIITIISFIFLWISSGISFWFFNIPYLMIGLFLATLGIFLYFWFCSIDLQNIYNSTIIDQLNYQYKTLLYIKDSILIEAIRSRDLTSNKAEEIKFITDLIKSVSTLESSILINGMLRKEGFTNYIPKDGRDTNED